MPLIEPVTVLHWLSSGTVIKRLPLNDSGTDLCANLSCDLQKLDLVLFI